MKFMKLGSKPDTFQTVGNDVRIMGCELPSDLVVHVGNTRFHLHKYPLLSKCAKLQKMTALSARAAGDGEDDEEVIIRLSDIPGGASAFEICAKFCYGVTATLNAHNVVAARCAAEYLEMHESVDRRNLVYKLEIFLTSTILRSWKDAVVALKSTRAQLPWSDDLMLVAHCVDAVAAIASVDPADVDWSYSYSRKTALALGAMPPADWWVEDATELSVDLFKQVVTAIKSKGKVLPEVVGEAVKAYAYKKLPPMSTVAAVHGDAKMQSLIETITQLLPGEKGSVACSFLLKLLRAVTLLRCSAKCRQELIRRVGRQLEEASAADLLIPTVDGGGGTVYDVDAVMSIVDQFVMQDATTVRPKSPSTNPRAAAVAVAKVIDGYLYEVAKDANLPLAKFVSLAEMAASDARPVHDGLYHAVDMYLKEHTALSKAEKKRICGLIDCRKLSPECSAHAVQNDRLPLRTVVQVLFHQQTRAAVTAAAATTRADSIGVTSYESSRSAGTTNTEEEDWVDGVVPAMAPAADDVSSMKATKVGTKGKGGETPKKTSGKGGDRAELRLTMSRSIRVAGP